jgi:hypothetical protein
MAGGETQSEAIPPFPLPSLFFLFPLSLSLSLCPFLTKEKEKE